MNKTLHDHYWNQGCAFRSATMILTIAIDPGLTGAVVYFADGEPIDFIDMPTRRADGSGEVCALSLAKSIREMRSQHPGAFVCAAVEKIVGRNGWSAGSAGRFLEGYGKVKATLEVLGIPYMLVQPKVWKSHYRLKGGDKNASRALAAERFPRCADWFTRKKDDGRAEALLIGLYHWNHEAMR